MAAAKATPRRPRKRKPTEVHEAFVNDIARVSAAYDASSPTPLTAQDQACILLAAAIERYQAAHGTKRTFVQLARRYADAMDWPS